MHLAVATLFLCSNPGSHVTLIVSSSLNHPFLFTVDFPLVIVGGEQAFSSEGKQEVFKLNSEFSDFS